MLFCFWEEKKKLDFGKKNALLDLFLEDNPRTSLTLFKEPLMITQGKSESFREISCRLLKLANSSKFINFCTSLSYHSYFLLEKA